MAGVLMHPVSIGTLFALSSAAALDSVWSAISLLCECKYIAVSKVLGGPHWREINTSSTLKCLNYDSNVLTVTT